MRHSKKLLLLLFLPVIISGCFPKVPENPAPDPPPTSYKPSDINGSIVDTNHQASNSEDFSRENKKKNTEIVWPESAAILQGERNSFERWRLYHKLQPQKGNMSNDTTYVIQTATKTATHYMQNGESEEYYDLMVERELDIPQDQTEHRVIADELVNAAYIKASDWFNMPCRLTNYQTIQDGGDTFIFQPHWKNIPFSFYLEISFDREGFHYYKTNFTLHTFVETRMYNVITQKEFEYDFFSWCEKHKPLEMCQNIDPLTKENLLFYRGSEDNYGVVMTLHYRYEFPDGKEHYFPLIEQ